MSVFLFLLAALPVFSNLVDFIVGKKGDRLLRARLVDFYVGLEGDWKATYQKPAALVGEFLRHRLGSKPIIYSYRVALYTAVTTTLAIIYHYIHSPEAFRDWDLSSAPESLMEQFYLPNYVADLVSWATAGLLVSRISTAQPWMAAIYTIILFAMVYICFTIVVVLQLFSIQGYNIGQLGGLDEIAYQQNRLFIHMLYDIGLDRSEDGYNFNYFGIVPWVVCIPLMLLFITELAALILLTLRPFLRSPLSLILERIDYSQKGLFGILSAAIGGLALVTVAVLRYVH